MLQLELPSQLHLNGSKIVLNKMIHVLQVMFLEINNNTPVLNFNLANGTTQILSLGYDGSSTWLTSYNKDLSITTNEGGNISMSSKSGYIWIGNNQIIPTKYDKDK